MSPHVKQLKYNNELSFEGVTNSVLAYLCLAVPGWEDICERVTLKPGTVIVHGGSRPTLVHFPINCVVVDLVSTLGDNLRHNEIQVAMHGRSDIVGCSALLSTGLSSRRSVVDHGGQAVRCSVDAARRLLSESPEGRAIVMDYAALAIDECAQLAAGEVQLKVVERVAAHLVQLAGILEDTVIPVTHIRIGERLGIRRTSVTESLQTLEAAGLISQADKGRVDIRDLEGLKKRVQLAWPMLGHARQAFSERLTRVALG